MTTLREALRELAKARAAEERLKKILRDAEATLVLTPEAMQVAEVRKSLGVQQDALKVADSTVRRMALEQFRATGDKKPDEHVSIILKRCPVYDAGEALEWVRTRAPFLLTLDVKAFERQAEEYADKGAPVYVEFDPEVRLSAHLGDLLLGA
jgi:hypothetical protein